MGFKSIRNKIIFWFLLVAITLGVSISYLGYQNAKDTLEAKVVEQLNAIANRQASHIDEYLVTKTNEAAAIAQLKNISETCYKLNNSNQKDVEEYAEVFAEVANKLIVDYRAFGFSNMLIISPKGKALFSGKGRVLEDITKKHGEIARIFNSINTTLATELSDFTLNEEGEPFAVVAVPIRHERRAVGILLLEFDHDKIEEAVNDYIGLGETGETILATNHLGKITFAADTKHEKDIAFKKVFDVTNQELPILKAIDGKNGYGEGIDYREIPVLAAWSYIPSLRSGLVVKIDKEEAFAPIESLKQALIISLLVSSFVVIIISILIATGIAKPIKKLTMATNQFAEGNFDATANITDNTEIGRLATSFNKMTQQIKAGKEKLEEYNRNLEAKINERTLDLQKSNEDLKDKSSLIEEQSQEMLAQNEELMQQQEEVLMINENLQEVSNRLKKTLLEEQEIKEELEEKNTLAEEQQKEILSQNEELRQQSEELLATNDMMENARMELETAYQKEQAGKEALQETFVQLKEAQSQLVQSEKMSSLGQLTAGIAHEINNPINFVYAGTNTLKMLIDDIGTVLDKYDGIDLSKDKEELEVAFSEIQQFKDEIDFDEIQQDVQELIKDILNGAERTQSIVLSLKTFSRLGEGDMQRADLHDNLNSTIVILNPEIKNRIEIIKEYDPHFPSIECNVGEVNQVFMNLISNATQAIEGKGKVIIKTWKEGDIAYVSVSDNGSGMNESTKAKIFEPFFTTKDVGEGTGLGLSISHGIIEKHNGTIRVESQLGRGTSFIVGLPIDKEE
jgi:signal transduction histidine kinase/HAMP domain-containing protein